MKVFATMIRKGLIGAASVLVQGGTPVGRADGWSGWRNSLVGATRLRREY
jgi:hypothetical protein